MSTNPTPQISPAESDYWTQRFADHNAAVTAEREHRAAAEVARVADAIGTLDDNQRARIAARVAARRERMGYPTTADVITMSRGANR